MGSSLHVAEWSLVLSKEIPGWFIHLPADEPLACSCVLLLEISSAACVDMEGAQLRELAASGSVTHSLRAGPPSPLSLSAPF